MTSTPSTRTAVALTWLKTADDLLQHFTVCCLPREYSGESFWKSEGNNSISRFFNVVNSADGFRVICDTSLVPSTTSTKFCEGYYMGFSLSTSTSSSGLEILGMHPQVLALIEKFQLCGVPAPLVVSEAGVSFVFVKEKDIALLQCAVQELWDTQFRFSFISCPQELQVSALQSRQLTILASIYRFYKPISEVPKSFTIHCLGAESKEYTTFSSMQSSYSLLFNSLVHLGISDLQLVFIGPNLYPPSEDTPTSFVFEDSLNINISICCNLYHNFISQQEVQREHTGGHPHRLELVDLVILFQAGLWGYDSWHPTLEMFCTLPITQIVITSYSLLEGENDFDTLEEYCSCRKGNKGAGAVDVGENICRRCVWNFEDEKNPYACTEPISRTSAPDCDTYYDNCAWQSVSFQ